MGKGFCRALGKHKILWSPPSPDSRIRVTTPKITTEQNGLGGPYQSQIAPAYGPSGRNSSSFRTSQGEGALNARS